jgi:hypothetical protein
MVQQVRENMERANRRVYQGTQLLHFYDTEPASEKQERGISSN